MQEGDDRRTKEDEREVQRKLWLLQHAEKIGHVAKTRRYFGLGRASVYRWKRADERDGKDGLVNAKTTPENPPNQTPPAVAEKVLHLRRKYHLGPELSGVTESFRPVICHRPTRYPSCAEFWIGAFPIERTLVQ